MTNPYLITGPALISFSGGRTSAFMLKQILDAHGGTLPSHVIVVFANTGKEHEATLRFVHDCGVYWGVRVIWVEFRSRSGPPESRFAEVGFNSASRAGEPFAKLINQKSRVPNWQERWCTELLKVVPSHAIARRDLGLEPGSYVELIGLREDEWDRRVSGMARAARDGRRVAYPLADAGVRKADIYEFWAQQPFDLQLPRGMGNCTNCFAMGIAERIDRMRFHIADAPWWVDIEAQVGRFDRRHSMADLVEYAKAQPTLFDTDREDQECGLGGCGFV